MEITVRINVKEIRDIKRLIKLQYGNIDAFARAIGLKNSIVFAVLNKRTFKHKHIKKITKALGVDLEQIKEWEDV